MDRFIPHRLVAILWACGLFGLSQQSMAAAFQLWEQDGASIGNYHAGYAAAANDASTAFYNPAGLTRFKNQQIVLAGNSVLTSFKYQGSVAVNSINNFESSGVTAQGGGYGLVPALHYVAPLTDRLAFGFSVDVPFGLKTNYGQKTVLRYVSTQTSITVIDISPTLALKLNDKFSFGLGPDVQMVKGEFDQVATLGGAELDSDGINKATDTKYGYHLGGLYEFTPDSRVGLSYHSQVVHHLTGTSDFTGPLAKDFNVPTSSQAKLNITLPPYTALSAYHRLNPTLAVMATVIYTQWKTLQYLTLQNVAGIDNLASSTNIVVVIPQHFRNTLNYSVGMDYNASDRMILRTGVGYDQTPVKNAYRNVQLPDNDRYVIAFGGHYQATKAIGLDLAWMHLFINKAHIIPPDQVTGDEITRTNGSVKGGADVYGAQVTWDIL